jgi:hypothetical protein
MVKVKTESLGSDCSKEIYRNWVVDKSVTIPMRIREYGVAVWQTPRLSVRSTDVLGFRCM